MLLCLQATVMVVLFVLLEILLLAPTYGSVVPMAAGFALMLVVAVVSLHGAIMVCSCRHLDFDSNSPPYPRTRLLV